MSTNKKIDESQKETLEKSELVAESEDMKFILSRNIDADLEEAEKMLNENYQTFI